MVEYIEYFGVALFCYACLASDSIIEPIVIGIALTLSMFGLPKMEINL